MDYLSTETVISGCHPPSNSQTATYDSDASVVLVGFSGAGKQTLGVIASVFLRRRYVDFNSYFEQHEGITPYEYLSTRGLSMYREAETKITAAFLDTHRKNCVVAGLTGLAGNAQKDILKSFSNASPVIYVRRDKADLVLGQEETLPQFYEARDAFYRSSSSFDFFNLTQTGRDNEQAILSGTLKLKKTETDFIRFLCRIFGQPPQLLHSSDPFSSSYTYSLEIKLDWLETHSSEYEQLECGADVISLVIDPQIVRTGDFLNRISKQVAVLRRHTRAPIIIDVPNPSVYDPVSYFRLLRLCLRSAPDLLTVPLTANSKYIDTLASAKGNTKLIGTFHRTEPWNDASTPPQLSRLHDMARNLSCFAVRISHDPVSSSETLQCLWFAQEARKSWTLPLIAYNTGPLGRTSVCFNPVLSPVVLGNDGVMVKQAQAALYSSFTLLKKTFTLIGRSVSYSLSPVMHNEAYAACGMPHSFNLLQTDDFGGFHRLLEDTECGGVIVSLPFKTTVLPLLDQMSPEAREIGAVNTVTVAKHRNELGSRQIVLTGHNTDHIGIRKCIQQNLSPANLIREGSTALIVGAGGMARAAIHACRTLGMENICIHNRTIRNAEELAENLRNRGINIRVLATLQDSWPAGLRQPTVVISCIPAHSIAGQCAHELTLPHQWLQSRTGGVFIEVRENPREEFWLMLQ